MAKGKSTPVRTRIRANRSTFFWVVGFILICTVVLAFGARIPVPGAGISTIYGIKDIYYGIDIQGGIDAVFEPDGLDRPATSAELDSARSILELRLDSKNITEREITVDKTHNRIIVRYPTKTTDPVAEIERLGATAKLTFVDPDGAVVIEGADVKESYAAYQESSAVVVLTLNADGAKKFSDATGRLIGDTITIKMDDQTISSPTVKVQITDGNAIIDGMADMIEAKDLADKINAGALPFAIKATSSSYISATLGMGALDAMVNAGLVAFLAICLFMLLYYRLPGFVACFALLMQVVGQLLAISIPQFPLTLPGIAGIILSVGMGVDANVIISERIKEELRSGNSLRFSISAGFQRAFAAVVDGNATVAITAILLMIFGSGAILSFGYTLLTGVILNMITGVTMSRLMTGSLSLYSGLQNPWLYGGRKVKG